MLNPAFEIIILCEKVILFSFIRFTSIKWDKSRFVAYIYDNYGIRNLVDQGPSVILLMDWDRTGMKLQSTLSTRFGALDLKVDEDLWRSLVKNMKSEGKTVESLRAHAITLREMISDQLFPHSLE